MKILIMGLSGAGKTVLAQRLHALLISKDKTVTWINADKIRSLYQDWDFSHEGRLRQAQRLSDLANVCDDDYVLVDFIAPLKESRDIFKADFTIWMDTKIISKYEDTDKIFEPPIADLIINDYDYSINDVLESIININSII